MICKICNTKTSGYKKIKKGKICNNCYAALPVCIQKSICNLTCDEIKLLEKNFYTAEQFIDPKHYTPWMEYKNLSLSLSGIILEKKHILLFKDLQSAWFSFIPRKYENDTVCFGDLCLHFSFRGIPYEFSTLAAHGTIPYTFTGSFTPSYPTIIKTLSQFIENGISRPSHTIEEEKARFEYYQEKYKFWQEENRKEQQKREQEKRRRHKESRSNSSNTQSSNSGKDELHQALDFFHLAIPFSKQELKNTYRSYMRQCHPDQQHTTATFTAAQVNIYYELLEKYAS